MKPHRVYFLLPCLVLIAFTLTGCDTVPTDSQVEFTPTLYLEAYLKAGSPLENIFVATTAPLYETYNRDLNALPNANVTVQIDNNTHVLTPVSEKPGYYSSPDLIVESGKTYLLTVIVGDQTAQAQTTVPFPPSVVASALELSFEEDPFSASWSGQTQSGYFTSRKAKDLGDPIPLERQFGGFGGFGGTFDGAIDTTGFTAARDSLARAEQWRFVQNQSTTLAWQQFSYYGTYAFLVYTIDQNYADFLASSQQNPQVLDEPQFHVSGGIGIFASMSADSVLFTISP